jgi:hypothetical protein
MLAAALQTKPADLASIGRCHVCNDTAHHNVLDALAVGTRHGTYLLAEESSAFVHLGFVATLATAIFEFPSHFLLKIGFAGAKIHNSARFFVLLQQNCN